MSNLSSYSVVGALYLNMKLSSYICIYIICKSSIMFCAFFFFTVSGDAEIGFRYVAQAILEFRILLFAHQVLGLSHALYNAGTFPLFDNVSHSVKF